MEKTQDPFSVSPQRMGPSPVVEGDLIRIKPFSPEPNVECLNCGHGPTQFDRLIFQGMHVLERHACTACGRHTWRTLPSGHDGLFPAVFGNGGKNLRTDPAAMEWLTRPLLRSLFDSGHDHDAAIKVETFVNGRDAIILNCLDNRFGHAFAKLWNASILRKKYPRHTLLVIIPVNLRWLVPNYIDIIWTVEGPLHKLNRSVPNLASHFADALAQFENVWLSKGYTHLSLHHVDLPAMLRATPFQLESFSQKKARVTFVLREDRFWHGSGFEYLLYKAAVKLGFPKTPFVHLQNRRVKAAAKFLKRQLSDLDVVLTGIGRTGVFPRNMQDSRRIDISENDEREWCRIYADSHIVIGVHGSNMLIPTALAAGFIEILPREKIRHIAEDTLMDHPARLATFLGRHVDAYASPRLVVQHSTSMIRHFPYLFNNFRQQV